MDKKKLLVPLGNKIRYLRHSLHLTQEELSEKIGCHRNAIAKIERGETDTSYTMILKIAKGLEIKPSELMPY